MQSLVKQLIAPLIPLKKFALGAKIKEKAKQNTI
jgi:hypothetical protein